MVVELTSGGGVNSGGGVKSGGGGEFAIDISALFEEILLLLLLLN